MKYSHNSWTKEWGQASCDSFTTRNVRTPRRYADTGVELLRSRRPAVDDQDPPSVRMAKPRRRRVAVLAARQPPPGRRLHCAERAGRDRVVPQRRESRRCDPSASVPGPHGGRRTARTSHSGHLRHPIGVPRRPRIAADRRARFPGLDRRLAPKARFGSIGLQATVALRPGRNVRALMMLP